MGLTETTGATGVRVAQHVLPVYPNARACEGANAEPVLRNSKCGSAPKWRLPRLDVTVLKLCRCIGCQRFDEECGTYYCDALIGGTRVCLATGERTCEPAPEAWHYCAEYDGPLISGEVLLWK